MKTTICPPERPPLPGDELPSLSEDDSSGWLGSVPWAEELRRMEPTCSPGDIWRVRLRELQPGVRALYANGQDIIERSFFGDTPLKSSEFFGGAVLIRDCLFAGPVEVMPASFTAEGILISNAGTRINLANPSLLETCLVQGEAAFGAFPSPSPKESGFETAVETADETAGESPTPSGHLQPTGGLVFSAAIEPSRVDPTAKFVNSDLVISLEAEPTPNVFPATIVVPVTEAGAGSAEVVASDPKVTALPGTWQGVTTNMFEPTALKNSVPDVAVTEVNPASWRWRTARHKASGAAPTELLRGSGRLAQTGVVRCPTVVMPVTVPANGRRDRWIWHTRRIRRGSSEVGATHPVPTTAQDPSGDVDASKEMISVLNPTDLIVKSEEFLLTEDGKLHATKEPFSLSVGFPGSATTASTRLEPTQARASQSFITQRIESKVIRASQALGATATITASGRSFSRTTRFGATVLDETLMFESRLIRASHFSPTVRLPPSGALGKSASMEATGHVFDATLDWPGETALIDASSMIIASIINPTLLSPTQLVPSNGHSPSEGVEGTELTPAGRRRRSPFTRGFTATGEFAPTIAWTVSGVVTGSRNLRRTGAFGPTDLDATLVIDASNSHSETDTFTASSTFSATHDFSATGTLVFPARSRVDRAEHKKLSGGAIVGILIAVVLVIVIVLAIVLWALTRQRPDVPVELEEMAKGPEAGNQTDPLDDDSLVEMAED